jgi:cytochrome b561
MDILGPPLSDEEVRQTRQSRNLIVDAYAYASRFDRKRPPGLCSGAPPIAPEDSSTAGMSGTCRAAGTTNDPTILPVGIEVSDDQLLAAPRPLMRSRSLCVPRRLLTIRGPRGLRGPHSERIFHSAATHWLMAAMVLAMLFIGIGLVSMLQPKFLTLIAVHRPLGIAIVLLALFRLGVRLRRGRHRFRPTCRFGKPSSAKASHYVLYALLIAMPLVGWSMLSAGGYPIVLDGPIHLPKIMPDNDELYAFLRSAPHDSRISVLRDHPSPCRGRAVLRADTAGRRVCEHDVAMVEVIELG